MSPTADLAVIGAGPAGCRAALAASAHGLDVVLFDAFPAAGGQIYRAPTVASGPPSPEEAAGNALRAELAASGVRQFFSHRVWSVAPGFEIAAAGNAGTVRLGARAVVAATGTSERVAPLPGWTTPGVIGLAAATILLKSERMAPGRQVVVAGCGPLVPAVAAGILKAGGGLAAVVDLSSPAEWLRHLPGLASRPRLLARGLGWWAELRQSRVPVFWRHAVTAVEGDERVERVVLRPVDREWRVRSETPARRIATDAVALGHGLVPSTEVTRLLGAKHTFRDGAGGWVADATAEGETSLPGLFVAGDNAGIAGADVAAVRGELAGLAAARHLGRLSAEAAAQLASEPRARLRGYRAFAAVSAAMMQPRPGLWSVTDADTVVCRCEDVTLSEIAAAAEAGARDINELKVWTRCGMGACQGRFCADAAAAALAGGASREAAGQWTARTPLRPVPMAALADGGEATTTEEA